MIRLSLQERDPWHPYKRRYDLIDFQTKHLMKASKATLKDVKPVIRKLIRTRYTYNGRIPMRISGNGGLAMLTIVGPRNDVSHFKHKDPRKVGVGYMLPRNAFKRKRDYVDYKRPYRTYLQAEFLRGDRKIFERGFAWNNTYFERDASDPRLPIFRILGASVPEMAGHEPEPAHMIERAINKLLEAKVGAMLNG